jgi:hypothetical protein
MTAMAENDRVEKLQAVTISTTALTGFSHVISGHREPVRHAFYLGASESSFLV